MVVWYSNLFQNFPQFFFAMHIVKGFSVVNETEVDVFLEFLCFFYDPIDVANLISGSSAFLSPAVHLEVLFHILLKPSLKYFEHYLGSM